MCTFIIAQNNISVFIAKDISKGSTLSQLKIKTTITNNNNFDIIITRLSIPDDFGNAITSGSSYIIATGYGMSNDVLTTSNKFYLTWYPENQPKSMVKLTTGQSYTIIHPLAYMTGPGPIGFFDRDKIIGLSKLEVKLHLTYLDTKNSQWIESVFISNRLNLQPPDGSIK